jgi:hypothetical protein
LPLGWAATQYNLANALTLQAKAAKSAEKERLLREAVVAYRAALGVYTHEALPEQWAMAQQNLGRALQAQAQASERADRQKLTDEAILAYRSVIEVHTREAQPRSWAGKKGALPSCFMSRLWRRKGMSGLGS